MGRKKEKRGGLLNRIVFAAAAALCIAGTYIGCKGYEMHSRAVTRLPVEQMAAEMRSREDFTYYSDIPQIYNDAVISAEDRRFYLHHGVDIISIARAFAVNIKEKRLAEGGSTITQQLAKNVYYTQEKNFVRKAAEVFTAAELEKKLSKDEILELYYNSIYYGDGCTGITAAAEHYFGTEPSGMNDYQCTLLAGVPNAPSLYAPTVNPELAGQRQIQVLNAMVSAGKLTEERKQEILTSGEESEKTTID